MNRNWRLTLGAGLVALSIVLYFVHFLIFDDLHHILIYGLGDIAFVPLEVLLVTLILHELLSLRERRALMQKLNMVIGAFFSETGTELLSRLTAFDPDADAIATDLVPTAEWTDSHFSRATKRAVASASNLDSRLGDLEGLKEYLLGHRAFLLRLLENQNLLEHESFTDLLWAVFHLTEELASREDTSGGPDTDLDHLSGDLNRAYGLLIKEWLSYMLHLKSAYPYLFSLAMRSNPLDPEACVEVC